LGVELENYELTADDLVAVGLLFEWRVLHKMYSQGVFPWPHPDEPSLWFSPQRRGILFFDELHVPKRLKRSMKKDYHFTINKNFEAVIRACAKQPRKGQNGTWIIDEMIPAYAASLECWNGDKLIGGIYGVKIGRYFSAESMFGRETNVSKLCLLHLVEYLRAEKLEWMDIQMVTSVTHQFGGRYVDKKEFIRMLAKAVKYSAK